MDIYSTVKYVIEFQKCFILDLVISLLPSVNFGEFSLSVPVNMLKVSSIPPAGIQTAVKTWLKFPPFSPSLSNFISGNVPIKKKI